MLALSQHLSCVTFVRTAWLFANRAGIHVDFEAHRHFNDFRCVPGRFRHLRFSRFQRALKRRNVQVPKSYSNRNRNGKLTEAFSNSLCRFFVCGFLASQHQVSSTCCAIAGAFAAQQWSSMSASSLLVKSPFPPGQIVPARRLPWRQCANIGGRDQLCGSPAVPRTLRVVDLKLRVRRARHAH